ncbi:hypothetical protein, variant [Aphanomyces astaci]|uniref:Cation efflux protein transmembrane domain-containing protein n=1 Tax=Aphanomyces astaci TaxID=112090 RepID=W4FJ60_APHAT|nr:hypothetical protein, variant [Aphanomyces astaci]ETV66773.1 hypothetical protein, variant [Aphanomyces astaci]|eukprot:XP_009843749.1 hypothetical protein, variant [Aphanomyces astaci]
MAPHGHSHAGYGATNEATPLVSSPKKKSSIALSESSLRARKKLQWACLFSLVFMVAEVVGGFMAGSLAIMTDAAHLLSDVAGFCISLFAIWVQTLPASSKMTFGFHRAEILGAIVSVLVIWVLTGFLVYAAIERFQDAISDSPQEHVDGKLMFIVAVLGLVVNLALMKILGHSHSHGIGGASHGHSHGGNDDHHDDHHGHSHGGDDDHHGHSHGHDEEHGHGHNEPKKQGDDNGKPSLENLNIQAAYIHALGDFIQSLGVCIAGALIWYVTIPWLEMHVETSCVVGTTPSGKSPIPWLRFCSRSWSCTRPWASSEAPCMCSWKAPPKDSTWTRSCTASRPCLPSPKLTTCTFGRSTRASRRSACIW